MNPKDFRNPTTVGLIDGTSQKRGAGMAQTPSSSRIWIALALIFLAVSIGLSGYIIYVKVFETQTTSPGGTEYIIATHQSYFKTVAEQQLFEEQYYRDNTELTAQAAEPTYIYPQLSSCFFTCNAYTSGNSVYQNNRTRRAAVRSPLMEWVTLYKTIRLISKRDVNTSLGGPINHGCCISRLFFTSPDTAINFNFINVTLVTINKTRQYFPTQKCNHAIGCTGCGCAQEIGLYPAVVINPDYPLLSTNQYRIDTIRIDGCCKCFNNRKPPAPSN